MALSSPLYSKGGQNTLTVDFILLTLSRARYSEHTVDLNSLEAHLLQGAREMPDLKLWQLQGLLFSGQ